MAAYGENFMAAVIQPPLLPPSEVPEEGADMNLVFPGVD